MKKSASKIAKHHRTRYFGVSRLCIVSIDRVMNRNFMNRHVVSSRSNCAGWGALAPITPGFFVRFALSLAINLSPAISAVPALAQIRLPAPDLGTNRPQTSGLDTFEFADRNADRAIRYLVYTTPATDRRLAQVRRFVPTASFGDLSGDLVIQAGLFESEEDASDRLIALASQGIAAEILQVQVNPPRRATLPEADANDTDRAYYVVIPGDMAELSGLASSLRSLLGETNVAILEEPYGTHISIGPFEVRDDAQLVEGLLRDRDVSNARVYYDRGGSLF